VLRGPLDPEAVHRYGVFAGVLPQEKFLLVQALQRAGHVVGMTGDGVNDAPALRQADVGIAVANASDVAKAAASLVLTRPGLREIVLPDCPPPLCPRADSGIRARWLRTPPRADASRTVAWRL
jgi:hypothetical protein